MQSNNNIKSIERESNMNENGLLNENEEIYNRGSTKRLENTWIIYDHEKNNNHDYEQSTRILGSFNLIGEYWFFRKKTLGPSKIFYKKDFGKPYYVFNDGTERNVSAISIFKKGIEPKWEDPMNINGGEISIRKFFKNKKNDNRNDAKNSDDTLEILEEFWNNLVLFCITEQSKAAKYITGIRIVDSSIISAKKPLYRIELWFSDKKFKETYQHEFKQLFNVLPTDIFYKDHS